MNKPYYFTWSEQDNPNTLPVVDVSQYEFILKDHSKVMDLSSVSFQASFGHKPQQILDNLKLQLDQFSIMSPKATYSKKDEVSEELLKLINLDGGKIFYTVSGAESVENAAKIARSYTGKKFIACRNNSYHGATFGALALTGDWRNKESQTFDDWTVRVLEPDEDPDFSKSEKILIDLGIDKIAAICLETVSGINGVIDPPQKWWDGVQTVCKKNKILLIVDEVICGFYRTGNAFGFQNKSIEPDLVCMAKAITGGTIPFGAVWTSQNIADSYGKKKLVAGLTSYAHPMGLAALNAVLDLTKSSQFKANLKENIQVFQLFLKECNQLSSVIKTRQTGMLGAIEIKDHIKLDWNDFISKGFYISINTSNAIILAPALTFEPKVLKDVLQSFLNCLKEITQ